MPNKVLLVGVVGLLGFFMGVTVVLLVDRAYAPARASGGDVSGLYDRLQSSVVSVSGSSLRAQGSGSGLVLDKQGDILTNYHVVQGFNQLDVKLIDGTALDASVLNTNPADDLAVIKVNTSADKLVPISFGNSDRLRSGQEVIAIGYPFDLGSTITQGVVSGLGRTLQAGRGQPQSGLIQTDAAINPGNSGGGLFDSSGALVGITNAIENPSGADVFAGVGYAIPSNTIQRDLPALLKP